MAATSKAPVVAPRAVRQPASTEAAVTSARTRRVIIDSPIPQPLIDPNTKTIAALVEESGEVTAVIPRDFVLTRDDGVHVPFTAGTKPMSRYDAEHWYSKAQGVTIYDGKSKE